MGKNKKQIGFMRDELGGKIMKELVLMDDDKVDKKAKGTKICVIKRCITFDNYLECEEKGIKILKSQ